MDLVWFVSILGVLGVLAAMGFAYLAHHHREQTNAANHLHNDALKQVKEDAERRVNRIERASEQALDRAEHALIRDLMPIADALMAAENVSDADPKSVKQGVRLVHQEFDRVLAKHGVQKLIPQTGDSFDPIEHEAVEQREVESGDSNRIAQCFRAGFRQGEDVLRPAMVAVSRVSTELSFPEEHDHDDVDEEVYFAQNHVSAKAD